LDSGASVHIFKSNIINNISECRKSNVRIKGVGGVVLEAIEEGTNRFIGNYLIVPDATANLVSVSELTKHGIEVLFVDNKATIVTDINQYDVKRSSDGLYYIRQKLMTKMLQDQDKNRAKNQNSK
jgi:hypothetical protein